MIPSPPLSSSDTICNDSVHVISQFFIPSDPLRYREIQYCLQQHVKHPDVDVIHLLVEKLYSNQELGVFSTEKIKQIHIGCRLTFEDVFVYARTNKLHGYIAFMNSDMYFARDALQRIRKHACMNKKKCAPFYATTP